MSATPAIPDATPLTHPLLEKALLTHLNYEGPTIHEVATNLLRVQLKILYPDLGIDPDTTVIAAPTWEFVDGELIRSGIQYIPLSRALIYLSLEGTAVNYLEGEHFLTRQTGSDHPIHLEVSIEKIAQLLNDLAAVFFIAFKEQQLDYWNATGTQLPRWEELSDGLRKALNVQEVGKWDADHCAIAQAVSAFPDKQERVAQRPEMADIQACMIDIDTPDGPALKHQLLTGIAVLQGRYKQRDILLMYTIEFGYETFPSLQALGTAIRPLFEPLIGSDAFSWRLVEPEGNFFDHMAWALICTQLKKIELLNNLNLPTPSSQVDTVEPPPANEFSDQEATRLEQLEAAIPDWLLDASTHELSAYSKYLIELSALRDQALDDLFSIPPIQAFAQQKMRDAITADKTHKGADKLPLDELQITVTESFTAGGFTLPNPFERQTQTLGEFALTNSPPYLASVRFKQEQTVPDWLTVHYLTGIAEQVDIGKIYPQLIKTKLLDDPFQAPRQKDFYKSQLRSLLPLLALECKVRQQGNVDERGYSYITELVKPTADNRQPVVIRPLSMRPHGRLGSASDSVLNMFIIGPRNPEDGPCLLYRPLLDNPLLQFPSLQNMLYAMHQPGELRDSILAWLPDQALSFNYSQYMFPIGLPSPWLSIQSLSEPWNLHEWTGPVVFSSTELTGDVFDALFDANAKAMVELADRQALSNAQRRWALLADSGWAIFNVTSNFLNGSAGVAVWAWQIISDIQQTVDAHNQGNDLIQWTSLGDVLMSLAIIIAHQAHQHRQAGPRRPSHFTPVFTESETSAAIQNRPTVVAYGSLPHSQYATVALGGSIPRRTPEQLDTYLDSLKVVAPDLQNEATILTTTPASPASPLHELQNIHYAQVGQRWFEVATDENDSILVVDPQHPSRQGPRLIHGPTGSWHIDTSLRLLGSGVSLKNQLKTRRLAKAQRREVLETQLAELKARETPLKSELRTLYGNFMQEKEPTQYQLKLQHSLAKTEELSVLYQEALARFKEWREMGGTVGYAQELLRLSIESHKHLSLWMSVKQISYSAVITRIESALKSTRAPSRQPLVDDINLSVELSHEMQAKLVLLNRVQGELADLGVPGVMEVVRLKELAPKFTQWDLKTNEIATSYELCIREQAAQDMEQARTMVAYVIHRAGLASKALTQMIRGAQDSSAGEDPTEFLLRIVDDYISVSQRIKELPGDYPDLVEPAQLARLNTLVDEFQYLAQSQLDNLLSLQTDSATGSATAGPSRLRPKTKVIKPRRQDQPKKPADAPRQEPLKLIQPWAVNPSTRHGDYLQTISDAMELNIDTTDFIKRTQKDALRPKRVPADMQDIFDQQALKLEQSATAVDTLNADPSNASKHVPVANLPLELREGAARLRGEGINTRAKMLKIRKPRQSYFQWLLDNNQVRVTRNDAGRIKTQQQDYFQEYVILDTANNDQPLWLAHFHYPSLKAPAYKFTAAHLKIADSHLQRLTPTIHDELTHRTPLDNQVRKLSDPLMQAVFLKLERPQR